MVKKHLNTEEIEKLNLRIEELESDYRRVLADYKNQERRFKDQEILVVKMANSVLLEKLLLNLDSLILAQSHLKDKGLEMVIGQIFSTLSQEGLVEIKTDNQPFDPVTMDCTEITPGEKDMVVETISKGYYLFDKVLRPAKVKVGDGMENSK